MFCTSQLCPPEIWNGGDELNPSFWGCSKAFPSVLEMLLGLSVGCQVAITKILRAEIVSWSSVSS